MNFIFLMDPLETVKYEKDTSFALMIGAYFKNHRIFFLPRGGMVLKDGVLFFKVTEVIPQKDRLQPFVKKDHQVWQQPHRIRRFRF
jgi:hypothetical protein